MEGIQLVESQRESWAIGLASGRETTDCKLDSQFKYSMQATV